MFLLIWLLFFLIDKKRLREYLQNIYTDGEYSTVTPLPDWVEIHVRDIFTPLILVGDRKGDKKQRLESYNELFHKEGVKQKRIMLLGEAGAGKTTFCQHLVDVWCNPSSRRQFDDVDIIKQLQFLFYISCRFAESHETVLNMIDNQLFDDEKSELRDIAHSVLRHNADSCLILMDGFDELQRSAQAKTGKRGDITGMPSLSNIQNCTLVTTSRPWKFLSIPNKEQEKFRRLELDGIKDLAELVKTMFQEQQVEDPAKLCTDFLDAIKERELSELMKFPIMLLFAIDVWVEKGSLPKSVSLCYINMIELAILRSARKREEANVESRLKAVEKLRNKYSESAKYLPNPLSNFESLKQDAGLLLNLGQLAYDLLLQPNGQTLIFERGDCKKYNINKLNGSLEYCLDLGLLIKIESTVKGSKQKENFQFCHKTYQEFFAALWLSNRCIKEGSQEMSHIHSCIKNVTDLDNHSVLIQFLCGLCPQAGTELWKYVAQNISCQVQNQVLRTMKEARDCCDHQGDHLYYCTRKVIIDKYTTDEDVSLLCKMNQYNSCYLKYLIVSDVCLSSSQCHSLLRSASSAIELEMLVLHPISCQSNDSSENLLVLDLSNHCRLRRLALDKISINGLVLPSQEELQLENLSLNNLVLSHDSLVNIFSLLPTVTEICRLDFTSVSCSGHQDGCPLPVLDLHNHCGLWKLELDKISISGLVLPSLQKSQLSKLSLNNLVLAHDNLVNICSSLSSVIGIYELRLINLFCRGHRDGCCLPVLDLHNLCRLQWLALDKISISGLVVPSQKGSQLIRLYLNNLVLPHDSLVNLCSSLSTVTGIEALKLTRLSCSEHQDGCSLPVLDLHNVHRLGWLTLDKISISGLYLYHLVLPHDNLVNLCSSVSSGTGIKILNLTRLSCSEHQDGCSLPVLDLHNDCGLEYLTLDKISISGLVLPSQGSLLRELNLDSLVLQHDELVNLCSSLSSVAGIRWLRLTRLSCSEHQDGCSLPVLDLHSDCGLEYLTLDKISISGLVLPSQEGSLLRELNLDSLVLPHDELVNLCSSLSSVAGIGWLKLTRLSCSEHQDGCSLPVLDLHNDCGLEYLTLHNISMSGLVLPSQEGSQLRYLDLNNLLLPHENMVGLCSASSSLPSIPMLELTHVRCNDHDGILVHIDLGSIYDIQEQLSRSQSSQTAELSRSQSSQTADVRRHFVCLSCSDHGASCELPSLN